jgi:hypothetical protein
MKSGPAYTMTNNGIANLFAVVWHARYLRIYLCTYKQKDSQLGQVLVYTPAGRSELKPRAYCTDILTSHKPKKTAK